MDIIWKGKKTFSGIETDPDLPDANHRHALDADADPSQSVLLIRDILVRIRMRILGTVPLSTDPDVDTGGPKTYGSYGSGYETQVKSHKKVTKQ
jgi:hypothetical protein